MNTKILQHPSLNYSVEIQDICRPLNQFNISYFSHACINDQKFSVISSNPNFLQHYLENDYYHADIHAANNPFGKYILLDTLEFQGESEKLYLKALEFGVKNTFTIIQNHNGEKNYYHFATHRPSKGMYQFYLNNIDLHEMFILHFKNKVSQSKELSSSYERTFEIDSNTTICQATVDGTLIGLNTKKSAFIQSIQTNNFDHQNLNTNQKFQLSPQQKQCLNLLAIGKSSKQIASLLNLSCRTVEHYLQNIRKVTGSRNCKELIAAYYAEFLT